MSLTLERPIIGACIALFLAAMPAAGADTYPSKPIRIIVPSAPSSGPDIITRMVGIRLTGAWGQQVVADNRPGAAGNIAAEIAAKAAPDGYTLFMATSQQVSGPYFFEKVGYHLVRDFSPISLIAAAPYVLSIHPSVAATSIKELIALAKAKPGSLYYGSSGIGGAPYLAAEMLKTMTGIDLVHVAYKSVTYALIDTMSGQVQLTFCVVPAALPMIKQGKLRALAVTSLKRTALAPDLETVAETIPGYEIIGWYGLMAPAKTSAAIVATLSTEIISAIKAADAREKLATMGADPIGTSAAEFASFLRTQVDATRKTVEALNIQRN